MNEYRNESKPKHHKDKKSKPSTNSRRAAHIKWAGTAIALGTFPKEVAESNCNRAKKLTEAWRSERPKPSLEWVKRELELAGLRVVNDRPGRRKFGESDVLIRQQERLLSSSTVQPSSKPIGQDSSSTTRRTISDEIDTASSFVPSSRPLTTTRTNRDNQPHLVSNNLPTTVDGTEEGRTTTNNEGSAVGYHHASLPVLNNEQPTNVDEPIQQQDRRVLLPSTSSSSSFTPHVGLNLRELQHLYNITSSSRALVYQQMMSSFHAHHMSNNEASLSGITRIEQYNGDVGLPYQQTTTTTIPFQTARVHTAAIGFPFSSFTMMTQNQESLLNRYQQNARTDVSLNDHHTIQNLNSSSSTCPSRTFSVDQHRHSSSPARAVVDSQSQYIVGGLNPPHASSSIRRASNHSQYHDNLLLLGRYRTPPPPRTESLDHRSNSTTLTTTISSEPVQVLSNDIIEEQTRHTNITSTSNHSDSNYRNHNHTSQNFNCSSIFPSRTSCQVPLDQNGHSSPQAVTKSFSQDVVGRLNPPPTSNIRRRGDLANYNDCLLQGCYRESRIENIDESTITTTTLPTTTSIYSYPVRRVLSSDIIEEQTRRTNITTTSNPSDSNNRNDILVAESLLGLNMGLNLHDQQT